MTQWVLLLSDRKCLEKTIELGLAAVGAKLGELFRFERREKQKVCPPLLTLHRI
jgi:hypothetical protein